MNSKKKIENPLEDGLLMALRAIDNQIARELQRTPAERAEHGVQKWEPFNKRIEQISSLLLNCLGEDILKLDSILVLSQALTKTLSITACDLGEAGLGKVRSAYCIGAAKQINRDVRQIELTLEVKHEDGLH